MSQYGVRALRIELRRYATGSCIFSRQSRTAAAGKKPSPSETRQTARRWLLPKLQMHQTSATTVQEDHSHPVEHKWDERADDKAPVDHGVCNDAQVSTRAQVKDSLLVASANHRCCAFLAMPGPSVCSLAATEPHGYSAPIPLQQCQPTARTSGQQ
jgi:hypothetical protein